MTLNPAHDPYNLLVKPFIPVLWRDGRPDRAGVMAALTEAGRIRQIAASNPMDNVTLTRFLLAVPPSGPKAGISGSPTGASRSRVCASARTASADLTHNGKSSTY